MSEIRMKLRGWQAVAAGVVVVLGVGWRYASMTADLRPAELEPLRTAIAAELCAEQLPALRQALAAGDDEAMQALTAETVAADQVELQNLSARGPLDDLIVAFDVSVRGRPAERRYYKMRHRVVGGWEFLYEVSAWQYHLRLF